jgi:hypothetical protein
MRIDIRFERFQPRAGMIIVIYPVCSMQLLFNMANKVHNQNAPDETLSQRGVVDKFLGLQHNSHFFLHCMFLRAINTRRKNACIRCSQYEIFHMATPRQKQFEFCHSKPCCIQHLLLENSSSIAQTNSALKKT